MTYKLPQSVLVVIYAASTARVLMLQRCDDNTFWQSVTGSIEPGETPMQAAVREIKEELSIDIIGEGLQLDNLQRCIEFEIFPQFRHRYAPGVTHNQEHWFRLVLPDEFQVILSEHLTARWMTKLDAISIARSWSNLQAIEEFITP